jgi:beta-lactamase regulating signal transducer with metallopeptidase domain
MIATWLLYATMIAALIAAAGMCFERVVRLWRRSVRWIWLVALIASTLAPAIAMSAARSSGETVALRQTPAAAAASNVGDPRPAEREPPSVVSSLQALEMPVRYLCLVASLLVLALFTRATLAAAVARRRWPASELDGVRVLVTPDVGPAVIGFAHTEIVVPEWALALDARQRALMLRHEQEHLRARDPLLLLCGGVALVLMPWNLALWWQVRRLRLAIEIDCDARVLGTMEPTVTTAREYAALLLTVAQRAVRLRPAIWATALSESSTALERRILAMSSNAASSRLSRVTRVVRTATFGALVGGVVVVACETPRPDPLSPPQTRTAGTVKFTESTKFSSRDVTDEATISRIRGLVAQHFPEMARGDTSTRPMMLVVNNDGAVVASARGAATGRLRYKVTEVSDGAKPEAKDAVGKRSFTFKRESVPAAGTLAPPAMFAGLDGSSVAHTEILNFRPGVLGSTPASVILIKLKPGAAPPIAK